MTLKKRVTNTYVFVPLDIFSWVNFRHPIDEQKRVSVREIFEYLIYVHNAVCRIDHAQTLIVLASQFRLFFKPAYSFSKLVNFAEPQCVAFPTSRLIV